MYSCASMAVCMAACNTCANNPISAVDVVVHEFRAFDMDLTEQSINSTITRRSHDMDDRDDCRFTRCNDSIQSPLGVVVPGIAMLMRATDAPCRSGDVGTGLPQRMAGRAAAPARWCDRHLIFRHVAWLSLMCITATPSLVHHECVWPIRVVYCSG